jgi:hypothetical protein
MPVPVQAAREQALRAFIGGGARTTVLNGVRWVDRAGIHSKRQRKRGPDGELLRARRGTVRRPEATDAVLSIAKELHEQVPQTRFLWFGDGSLAS